MVAAIQRTPEELRVRQAYRHALWEIGDLSWALHAKQLEDEAFIEAAKARGARRIVLLCGRRYGKTRLLVVRAFQLALRNPGIRIPYAAKTWESALAYVFPEARFLIGNAPKHQKPQLVGGEIRFHNGSTIVISGSHTIPNADNLRGPAAGECIVDESGFNDVLTYLVDSVLQPQLLTTRGILIMASSAPLSPSHAFAKQVIKAKARKTLIKRRTRDAPHIAPEELDALAAEIGGWGSTAAERELECEIVTDESRAVVPEWRHHRQACTGTTPAQEHRHFYLSADLGYRHLTVVLIGWVDWYGVDVLLEQAGGSQVVSRTGPRLIVVGERVLQRPTSFDVQAAAAELEAEHHALGKVRARVADASPITVADLRRLHGKLRSGEPETSVWRLPRKDDLEGATNQVRLLVKRHQILIAPECEQLLADVNDGVWKDATRSEFEEVEADEATGEPGHHYDALAALVYLCRTADFTLCPEPAAWSPPNRRPVPDGVSRVALPSGGDNRVRFQRRR